MDDYPILGIRKKIILEFKQLKQNSKIFKKFINKKENAKILYKNFYNTF